MPEAPQGVRRRRTTLWIALAVVLVVLALVFIPPYISLSHYKSRVTQSVAAAFGRPVRLSDVELRMLPRPAFLLADLTVQEDPAYGAEPFLHANTVRAAIRLAGLWQGKLQISRISVDEASVNLVHMPDGRWNLDSLFHNASGRGAAPGGQQVPYLEATDSRVNLKNGREKLPFSLLNTDASMSRESNGDWHIRLRAQPARTDVSLGLGDTGIVRLEAILHSAPQTNQMPLHIDLDWREAQLGQLTRLLLGSDEGWRGDLTGELHLDGTASEAKVQSRLRAAGVHRSEFAPAAPLDFDATCAFTYHYSHRSIEGLLCDSPIGNGRARITGDLPGGTQPPKITVALDRIPAQAGLDLLRTMRSAMDPTLEADGTVSGQMIYDPAAAAQPPSIETAKPRGKAARPAQTHPAPGPLTGTFTLDGLRIAGSSLSRPIQVAHLSLEPAAAQPGEPAALAASIPIPAGGPTPLMVNARIALTSFQFGFHGTAALPRLHEFAHAVGSPFEPVLSQLAGDPAALDFTVDGPWVPPADVRLGNLPYVALAQPGGIRTSGTISLRNANWKADFLANPVLIASATLHLGGANLRWDPVEFSYGPVKGTATLEQPVDCDTETCSPRFTVIFGSVDAADLQSALLGARERGTLLSTLLNRLKPGSPSGWPQLDGAMEFDSLAAGPFKFNKVSAHVKIAPTGVEVPSFAANWVGGRITGDAFLAAGDKPAYTLNAHFATLKPAEVAQLAGLKATGGDLSGNGHLEFSGYTEQDLTASAKGTLHFDWKNGALSGTGVPPALAHFDRWSGDATIADNGISIQNAPVQKGSRGISLDAHIAFGTPAKLTFGEPAPPKPKTVPPVK